jgi:hypothetical protein
VVASHCQHAAVKGFPAITCRAALSVGNGRAIVERVGAVENKLVEVDGYR